MNKESEILRKLGVCDRGRLTEIYRNLKTIDEAKEWIKSR